MEQENRRTRGKGVKPSLVHVNVRVAPWVLEFYRKHPSYTIAMREVLTTHAQNNKDKES